jgi:hypothetical protein
VFEYSSGEMTSDKMRDMKKNLNSEFTLIFQVILKYSAHFAAVFLSFAFQPSFLILLSFPHLLPLLFLLPLLLPPLLLLLLLFLFFLLSFYALLLHLQVPL